MEATSHGLTEAGILTFAWEDLVLLWSGWSVSRPGIEPLILRHKYEALLLQPPCSFAGTKGCLLYTSNSLKIGSIFFSEVASTVECHFSRKGLQLHFSSFHIFYTRVNTRQVSWNLSTNISYLVCALFPTPLFFSYLESIYIHFSIHLRI